MGQVRPGTYRLETPGGTPIPKTWRNSRLEDAADIRPQDWQPMNSYFEELGVAPSTVISSAVASPRSRGDSNTRASSAQREGSQVRDKEKSNAIKEQTIPLEKPVEWLLITRLDPAAFRLFPRVHYTQHKRGYCFQLIILPNIILEVPRRGLSSDVGSLKGLCTFLPSFQSGTSAQPIVL
ncbi:hypothetical protein Cgig2_016545 [Carnegiea gigantea]|uniref:Uncharacterized protein n=1 Tax=Carnegiea gigantea TaxID=171969 RepID=A0A9Q1GIQ0_9CARY|nr:hypothetical protein Cgig2_016545 [Carnegiea gigantea]